MLRIPCPWCGPREVGEFAYGSEAHIARPTDGAALSDAEWADYLFMKTNTKGLHRERWMHAHGCRRWFNVVRHTMTDQVVAAYPVGEPGPSDKELRKLAGQTGIAAPRLGPGEGLVAGGEGDAGAAETAQDEPGPRDAGS